MLVSEHCHDVVRTERCPPAVPTVWPTCLPLKPLLSPSELDRKNGRGQRRRPIAGTLTAAVVVFISHGRGRGHGVAWERAWGHVGTGWRGRHGEVASGVQPFRLLNVYYIIYTLPGRRYPVLQAGLHEHIPYRQIGSLSSLVATPTLRQGRREASHMPRNMDSPRRPPPWVLLLVYPDFGEWRAMSKDGLLINLSGGPGCVDQLAGVQV